MHYQNSSYNHYNHKCIKWLPVKLVQPDIEMSASVTQESRCSLGRKAVWKPPYQSSGSETLKCFAPKMSKWDDAEAVFTLQQSGLCVCLVQGRRYNRSVFLLHCCLSTHLDWLTEVSTFYERNSSLCTVLQQIKTQKYKHAPIRDLAADQDSPQRDACYLQGLSDSLWFNAGTAGEDVEMSQV